MPKIVDHDFQRQQIARAAWRVINQSGVNGATVRDIAREAGLSTGALAHYFRDKQELVAHSFRLLAREITQRVRRRATAAKPGLERLSSVVNALLTEGPARSANAVVAFEFWGAAAREPKLTKLHRQLYVEELRRLITEYVREAVALGVIDSSHDPLDITDAIVLFGDGLWLHYVLDPSRFDRKRRAALVDAFIASLRSAPQARGNRMLRGSRASLGSAPSGAKSR